MRTLSKARRRGTRALLALVLAAACAACQQSKPEGDTASRSERLPGIEQEQETPTEPQSTEMNDDAPGHARNVILIVGDGMGIAHRELVRLTTVGRNGGLAMDGLTYQGWTRTDPADPGRAVTDSAAAATAIATGTRTTIGAIAVDVEGNPVTTLLERAGQAGRATGLVTTSRVTDATPAAFGAHVQNRDEESEIARQYVEETQVDLILGGGAHLWHTAEGTSSLIDRAQQWGYQYVSDADGLAAITDGALLGLFADGAMFAAGEDAEVGYDPAVPLPVMATKALEILSQHPEGFFLVIEEEGIDAMSHVNNAEMVIEAGRALDETVALARDFAAEEGRTLLVVVADHETGGLALESVDEEIDAGADRSAETGPFTIAGTDLLFDVQWTSGGHTAAATPASAEGPGAEAMVSVRDNIDIHDLVLEAMSP